VSGRSARERRREERSRTAGEEGEERRRRLLQIASAAVFLAVAAVAVLIVISASQTDGGDTELEDVELVARELRGVPQRGMALGDPAAKVTLVEFGDLQCPVCRGFSEDVIPEVVDAKVRGGEARIAFRSYTIIDSDSVPAAAAAIAAGEQGRGWSFVDLFYRNQGAEGTGYVTDEFLTEVARGAGVPDLAAWNAARRSDRVLAQVRRETAEAQRLGFDGTPSFAVEGPGTDGLEPLGTPASAEELEAAIDEAR
jgi:protein-disulfide isomerase